MVPGPRRAFARPLPDSTVCDVRAIKLENESDNSLNHVPLRLSMARFSRTTVAGVASSLLLTVFAKGSPSSPAFRHVSFGSSPIRANVAIPEAEHSFFLHPLPRPSQHGRLRQKLYGFLGVDVPLAGILDVAGYVVNVTVGEHQHFLLEIDTGRLVHPLYA